jgi:predicted ATPase
LAEAAFAQWDTPMLDVAYRQLNREHDNMRAVLQWAQSGGHSTIGLQLAGALWRFWRGQGMVSEGRQWLEEMLAVDRDEGRRTKDEGRRTKDEGRRTKDEGRRTKDERRRQPTTGN